MGVGPGYYATERPFLRLEALGRREGIPVVNLAAKFRDRSVREWPLFFPATCTTTRAARGSSPMASPTGSSPRASCLATEAEVVRAALKDFVKRHRIDRLERFMGDDIDWALKIKGTPA